MTGFENSRAFLSLTLVHPFYLTPQNVEDDTLLQGE